MQNISKQTTTKALQGLIGKKLEIEMLANAVLNSKKHINQTINRELAHCGFDASIYNKHIVKVWIGAVCSLYVRVDDANIIQEVLN